MKKRKNITESSNPNSNDIDVKNIREIIQIFHNDNLEILDGLNNVLDEINNIVELTIECLKNNGRLFYVGAGTSGRLGVLDAAECKPTFGVDDGMVEGIIAGGKNALFMSIEGAEDNIDEVEDIIDEYNISKNDIIIGISCSGTASFVLEFLKQTKNIDSKTALITFNEIDDVNYIDQLLSVHVGPEIITGSTRMKSGTATKMILNMISSISMIKLNKTYGNYMVDLKVINKKLIKRGIHIIKSITGVDSKKAKILLEESNGYVKNAIVMEKLNISFLESKLLLNQYSGSLREILDKGDIR